MGEKNFGRIAVCFVAGLLMVASFAGCKKQEQAVAAGGGAVDSAAGAQKSHLPLVEPGSVTLSMLSYQNWDASSYYDSAEGLAIENKIEEITGVKIKWECVSSDDYDTVAQTRLAAGVNLPDIIRIPKATVGLARYADEGLLVNMSKYMSPEKTPYTAQLFREQPIYKAYCTSPDGNIYGFPYCEYDVSGVVIQWNSIREDWLKKLGLSMPQTIEDLHDVLVAFRDRDPNGNGQKDETPLVYQNDGMYGLYQFKNAFGFDHAQPWSRDSNGKVQFDLVDPRFLEVLTTLNSWYKEKLLYSEVRTASDVIPQNRAGGVTLLASDNLLTRNAEARGVAPDASYVFLPLLKSTKYPSHQPKLDRRPAWHDYYSVTVDCKNPEVAVQWLDWVWASEESQVLRYWGFENDTYKIENGKKVYLDKVTKDPNGSIAAMRQIGGYPNFAGRESGESFLAMYPGQYPEKAYREFSPNLVDYVQTPIGTQEENDIYTRYWPDLDTYIRESVVGFITGTKPLSEWKTYVDTCNSMGLQEVIKVKQAWAERFDQYVR
jgi:putative aldouronate transport system substrate-binding protein